MAELTNEQVLEKTLQAVTEKFEKVKGETVSKADYETLKSELEKVKGMQNTSELETKFTEKIKAMEKGLFDISATLEANNTGLGEPRNLNDALAKQLTDEKVKGMVDAVSTRNNQSEREKLKYAVTSGRTGTVLITSRSSFIQEKTGMYSPHIRDIVNVTPTDMPYHVFDQVTGYTAYPEINSENGDAVAIDFTTAEKQVDVKRIAGIQTLSKRVLKSLIYIKNHLMRKLPENLFEVEDSRLLFGNGVGDNFDGLYKNAQDFVLGNIKTFAAGAVSSVANHSANGMVKITFAANHGLLNGHKITFANATAAGYNATFDVVWDSLTTILVSVAYVAEANTGAWTGTAHHALYHTVDGATDIDVLKAAKAFIATSRFRATAHVINPSNGTSMEMLKDTTGQPLEGIERVNGTLFIGGIPCVETDAMPFGYFITGDFNEGCEILQYTSPDLYMSSDVSYDKANKVAAIIEEELIFPIYNPYSFTKGKFSTAKTELETP